MPTPQITSAKFFIKHLDSIAMTSSERRAAKSNYMLASRLVDVGFDATAALRETLSGAAKLLASTLFPRSSRR